MFSYLKDGGMKLFGWFGTSSNGANHAEDLSEEDDIEIVAELHTGSSTPSIPENFMNMMERTLPVKSTLQMSPACRISPRARNILKDRNSPHMSPGPVRLKRPDHWSRLKSPLSVSKKSLHIRKSNNDSSHSSSPYNLAERDEYIRRLADAEASSSSPSTKSQNNGRRCLPSKKGNLDYGKLKLAKKLLRASGPSVQSSPSILPSSEIRSDDIAPKKVDRTPSGSESMSSASSRGQERLNNLIARFDKALMVTEQKPLVDDFDAKCHTADLYDQDYSATSEICNKSRLGHKSYLFEEIRNSLALKGIAIPKPKPQLKDEFPDLSDEARDIIKRAWSSAPATEVFADAFDIRITRKDLRTLRPGEWLNDEVINFYLQMVCKRSQDDEVLPKVYAFNTFFYPNITTKGYASVKRWTRKVDIFSFDVILIPVHMHNNHWCMAVIDITNKQIDYYDSLHGRNQKCLDVLRNYLVSEHSDKKKSPLDLTGWDCQIRSDCPTQMNGSDCGMFSLKFAEFASRRREVCFTQEHMLYYRQRTVYEIAAKTLM